MSAFTWALGCALSPDRRLVSVGAAMCSRSSPPSRAFASPQGLACLLSHPLVTLTPHPGSGTRRRDQRSQGGRTAKTPQQRNLDGGYSAPPGVRGRRLLAAGAETQRGGGRAAPWGSEDGATATPARPDSSGRGRPDGAQARPGAAPSVRHPLLPLDPNSSAPSTPPAPR